MAHFILKGVETRITGEFHGFSLTAQPPLPPQELLAVWTVLESATLFSPERPGESYLLGQTPSESDDLPASQTELQFIHDPLKDSNAIFPDLLRIMAGPLKRLGHTVDIPQLAG